MEPEPQRTTLTILAPLHDEEEVLPELGRRLQAVFTRLDALGVRAVALLVDDGSRDRTGELLQGLHAADPRVGFVRLSRNFGHQAALSAGLDHLETDAVVVIDGDLQDPPELIPDMIRPWLAGTAEVVYGVRESRDGGLVKRMCYTAFYRLFNAVVAMPIPKDSGDFALMDRCVYSQLRAFPERQRFLRGLRHWIGFRQVPFEYHRPERFAGRAKYSFRDLYKLATDGMASFSILPLKVSQFMSFVWAFVTAGMVVRRLLQGQEASAAAIDLTILLCLAMSMVFLAIYVASAYVGRMYIEIQRRPIYIAARHVPGVPSAAPMTAAARAVDG